ncbi:hypothetical protein [Pseudomonas fragi]|uniref:hypothetical protein n=1 Tax=Pseudomonas fragi TaxID=296 RepID=UPI0014767B3E|nr:hypothetical protein [Pseudomonas fragi]NNB34058.1 hypothetical protein [Pseudomonas fragi]
MKFALGLFAGLIVIGLLAWGIDASTDVMAARSSHPVERSQGGGIPVADGTAAQGTVGAHRN